MKKNQVKIVVIGDGQVGKTCILSRYKTGCYKTEYVPTIVDNFSKQITIDKKQIQMSLWDTAGQEEYQRLRQLSYPKTNCFLIVFDVTSPSSFENAVSKWSVELKEFEKNAFNIFLGNKIDRRNPDDSNQVSQSQAKNTIQYLGKDNYYAECSALTGQGINEVFEQAVEIELNRRKQKKRFCFFI